ncbi:hypothetical protein DL770_005284 [Monosporascus sp. CRB-9-2]|nr:hypothetical protein DL770_005284 [Monosporascus sp. CRB-9-2]
MDIQPHDGRELLRGRINKLCKETDVLQAENKTSQYRLSLVLKQYQAVESKMVWLERERTKLGEGITEIHRIESTRSILSTVCAGDKREPKEDSTAKSETEAWDKVRCPLKHENTGGMTTGQSSNYETHGFSSLWLMNLPKHNEAIRRYRNRQYRESAQSLNEALALAKEAQYHMFIHRVAVCWPKIQIELSLEDVAPAMALDAPASPKQWSSAWRELGRPQSPRRLGFC